MLFVWVWQCTWKQCNVIKELFLTSSKEKSHVWEFAIFPHVHKYLLKKKNSGKILQRGLERNLTNNSF